MILTERISRIAKAEVLTGHACLDTSLAADPGLKIEVVIHFLTSLDKQGTLILAHF